MKKFNSVLVLVMALFLVVGISSMAAACYGPFCCDWGDDATIVQIGELNTASIYQRGEKYYNSRLYGDPCLPFGCVFGGNHAVVMQLGFDNNTAVSQVGAMNSVFTFAFGGDNHTIVDQNGRSLAANVMQAGHYNQAFVTQRGVMNDANVGQIGLHNIATITQNKYYDLANILQIGCSNDATITQD
jgi:hypothetical protein